MKKGLAVYSIIFLAAFSILLVVSAQDAYADLVCGQAANSSLGYGQFFIFNGTGDVTISCSNIPDGICPEDYTDNAGFPAYCFSCIDPDCTGTVEGMVTDSKTGYLLSNVLIESRPFKYVASADLEDQARSRADGTYTLTAAAGTYYVSASLDGYDTQLIEVNIRRGSTAYANFSLIQGMCHDDCTNSYSRCNAECDGLLFNNSNYCRFYDPGYLSEGGQTIKQMCNNRIKGTTLFYKGINDTHAQFVDCCEGRLYTKYYAPARLESNQTRNLIKIEKIAKYNDVPVKVIVAYWKE